MFSVVSFGLTLFVLSFLGISRYEDHRKKISTTLLVVSILVLVLNGFIHYNRSQNAQRRNRSSPAQTQISSQPQRPTANLYSSQKPKLPVEGIWTGWYICGQGKTGLTLTVKPLEYINDTWWVKAEFSFYPIEENPNPKNGAFLVSGPIHSLHNLALLAHESGWINQPEGYGVVYLKGTFSQNYSIYSGDVEAPGNPDSCTDFYLEKN